MILRKKSIILLVCLAAMIAVILSSVGTTYAYDVNKVPTKETGVKLYVDAEGTKAEILDNSETPIFSSSLVWEPGAMHAVAITIQKPTVDTSYSSGSPAPLYYWLYPHVAKEETGVSMLTNKPNLADVLDAYIYQPGVYAGPGRPDLNSGDWIHLGGGSLSQLPNDEVFKVPLGELSSSSSVTHTLIIKMRESAGNEYNQKNMQTNVHITLRISDKIKGDWPNKTENS